MSWTLIKKLDTSVGLSEIKGWVVSWTLMKKLDTSAGPGGGPSREPRRDQEQGGGAGLRKLDFFCFSCYSTTVLWTLSL